MTKVKFIISSISGGWLVWSVNHTSKYENFELNDFNGIKCVGAISSKLRNGLLGTNLYKTVESCW